MSLAAALAITAGPLAGQTADPLTAAARTQFRVVHNFVLRSAEKIPEEIYSLQPTPEVRTVGEIFGHIADELNSMCTSADGGVSPPAVIEQNVSGKVALIAALTESIALCNQVLAGMDDRLGTEPVPSRLGPSPRLAVLYFAVTHSYEHYGNLVTYMRLQGIIPPSSEPAGR